MPRTDCLEFHAALILVAVLLVGCDADSTPESRVLRHSSPSTPNIILIVADDLGWTELGSYGSRYYETPHIDRLAAEGMLFRQAYANATNCSPSRASLMTGHFVSRHGLYTPGHGNEFSEKRGGGLQPLLPAPNGAVGAAQQFISEVLHVAGYRSAVFGKWHIEGARPGERLFDRFIVAKARHYDFEIWEDNVHEAPEEGEYQSDYMTRHALDFIRDTGDQPFFLYLPYLIPHSPYAAPQNLIDHFEAKAGEWPDFNPKRGAMVARLDQNVGEVMRAVEEGGLTESTLVIFMSDNGSPLGNKRRMNQERSESLSMVHLRGGKGSFYEGGLRVPLIARLPGRIPAGKVSDEVISGVDLFPTLAELSGGSARPGYELDGQSLLPVFLGRETSSEERSLVWHHPGYLRMRTKPVSVLRKGDFKLMHFYEDDRLELYDLVNDPGESDDLADRQAERARMMDQLLMKSLQDAGAKFPTHNPSPQGPQGSAT